MKNFWAVLVAMILLAVSSSSVNAGVCYVTNHQGMAGTIWKFDSNYQLEVIGQQNDLWAEALSTLPYGNTLLVEILTHDGTHGYVAASSSKQSSELDCEEVFRSWYTDIQETVDGSPLPIDITETYCGRWQGIWDYDGGVRLYYDGILRYVAYQDADSVGIATFDWANSQIALDYGDKLDYMVSAYRTETTVSQMDMYFGQPDGASMPILRIKDSVQIGLANDGVVVDAIPSSAGSLGWQVGFDGWFFDSVTSLIYNQSSSLISQFAVEFKTVFDCQ